MNKKRLHFGKALSFAFKLICKFPFYFLLPILLYCAIAIPFLYFDFKLLAPNSFIFSEHSFLSIFYLYIYMIAMSIFSFLFVFLQFILISGYIQISSKWLLKKEKPVWKDYFTWDFPLFGKFLAVSFIFGLLIYAGTFLLIIPGIVMMIVYFFADYILIDRHGGVRRSFGRSAELVNGVKWQVFWFTFISSVISIGPLFCLLVSYFISNAPSFSKYMKNFSILSRYNLIFPLTLVGFITILLNILFLQLVYIYLYKDLSAQQDAIDQSRKALTEEKSQEPREDIKFQEESQELK